MFSIADVLYTFSGDSRTILRFSPEELAWQASTGLVPVRFHSVSSSNCAFASDNQLCYAFHTSSGMLFRISGALRMEAVNTFPPYRRMVMCLHSRGLFCFPVPASAKQNVKTGVCSPFIYSELTNSTTPLSVVITAEPCAAYTLYGRIFLLSLRDMQGYKQLVVTEICELAKRFTVHSLNVGAPRCDRVSVVAPFADRFLVVYYVIAGIAHALLFNAKTSSFANIKTELPDVTASAPNGLFKLCKSTVYLVTPQGHAAVSQDVVRALRGLDSADHSVPALHSGGASCAATSLVQSTTIASTETHVAAEALQTPPPPTGRPGTAGDARRRAYHRRQTSDIQDTDDRVPAASVFLDVNQRGPRARTAGSNATRQPRFLQEPTANSFVTLSAKGLGDNIRIAKSASVSATPKVLSPPRPHLPVHSAHVKKTPVQLAASAKNIVFEAEKLVPLYQQLDKLTGALFTGILFARKERKAILDAVTETHLGEYVSSTSLAAEKLRTIVSAGVLRFLHNYGPLSVSCPHCAQHFLLNMQVRREQVDAIVRHASSIVSLPEAMHTLDVQARASADQDSSEPVASNIAALVQQPTGIAFNSSLLDSTERKTKHLDQYSSPSFDALRVPAQYAASFAGFPNSITRAQTRTTTERSASSKRDRPTKRSSRPSSREPTITDYSQNLYRQEHNIETVLEEPPLTHVESEDNALRLLEEVQRDAGSTYIDPESDRSHTSVYRTYRGLRRRHTVLQKYVEQRQGKLLQLGERVDRLEILAGGLAQQNRVYEDRIGALSEKLLAYERLFGVLDPCGEGYPSFGELSTTMNILSTSCRDKIANLEAGVERRFRGANFEMTCLAANINKLRESLNTMIDAESFKNAQTMVGRAIVGGIARRVSFNDEQARARSLAGGAADVVGIANGLPPVASPGQPEGRPEGQPEGQQKAAPLRARRAYSASKTTSDFIVIE